MIDRLIRLWGWVGGHRLLAGWLVALLCVSAFSGGIALGATREQTPLRALPAPPVSRPRAVTVTATVEGRRGARIVVRTRDGERVIVRTNESTTYRMKQRPVDATTVTRGSRITVLGRRAPTGVFVARVIVIRGESRGVERVAPLDSRFAARDSPHATVSKR